MSRLATRSGVRLCSLAVLQLVLGCISWPASATWTELPPLLYPRYFHRTAAGPAGQLIVFAGRREKNPGVGNTTWETEIYDPEVKRWSAGPNAMDKIVLRSTQAFISRLPDGTRRYKYSERTAKASPNVEIPLGTGTYDGRAFWWGEAAPLIFDFATGDWVQGTPPRGAAVYFDETTQGWVEETGASPRQAKKPPRRWVTPVPYWDRTGSATAAAPDGRIYVSGGIGYPVQWMDRRKGPEGKYALLDSLESYDTMTETWKVLAPMRRARQLHAAAVGRDGKLYVFGGYGHRGKVTMRDGETDAQFQARYLEMKALGRQALDSVEAYDPKADTWQARAAMPEGRHAMGAALGADGKIYVIGGAVSYSQPRGTDTVFVYDPAENHWEKGPSLIHARFHHAIAAGRDGKIYAIGGRVNRLTDTAGTATVEVLDTANLPKPEGWQGE